MGPAVDTTALAAFLVGFVSFVSPCVLPLVPGYLSAISGLPFGEVAGGRARRRVLGPALLFCASFTLMLVALGMTATGLGRLLLEYRGPLRQAAGVVIALMGLLVILTLLWPRAGRQWRPRALVERASTGGPVLAGLAFAVAWLPCTGPTLGAILTAASTRATVGQGGMLLLFYALGLAVPFILSAVAFSRVTRAFRAVRDHYAAITVLSGLVLVLMGALLYTNELTRLNAEALSLMDELGINVFAEL